MNIEELVASLKEQGLGNDQIIASLEQMVQEGKITPDDLERARGMLEEAQPEEQERAEASKIFGMDLSK